MRHSLWLAFGFVLALRPSAHAIDIAFCGQEIPSGTTGTLVNDLACGTGGTGVVLHPKATLQLNGHTITGGTISVYVLPGKKIVIEGPGEIAGASEVGVFAQNNVGRRIGVTIRNGVDIHDHGIVGIALGQGNRVKLDLDDVTLRNNAGGPIADCTGVKLKGVDVVIADNGAGLCGDGIKLQNATITGNGIAGIFSWKARVKLLDSTVTGNDAGGNGYDIVTSRRPKLVNTTCGRSAQVAPLAQPDAGSPSWAVCAGD